MKVQRRPHLSAQVTSSIQTGNMDQPITDIDVSLNETQEDLLRAQNFTKIDDDLNAGAGEQKVHLWYNRGNSSPITRIQLSFNDDMSTGLEAAGYHRVNKCLNAGASGSDIYLWFYRGATTYDVPIIALDVSRDTEDAAQRFAHGWERLACDLNRGNNEDMMLLLLKRTQPTYIYDITATAGFDRDAELVLNGYMRVDEDTNSGAGGLRVFIWYRHTTNSEGAIRGLKISTNQGEFDEIQAESYQQVQQDLNQGAGRNQVFLWFTRDGGAGESIKTITLIPNLAVETYQNAGVQVIDRSLNTGSWGVPLFLCFS